MQMYFQLSLVSPRDKRQPVIGLHFQAIGEVDIRFTIFLDFLNKNF